MGRGIIVLISWKVVRAAIPARDGKMTATDVDVGDRRCLFFLRLAMRLELIRRPVDASQSTVIARKSHKHGTANHAQEEEPQRAWIGPDGIGEAHGRSGMCIVVHHMKTQDGERRQRYLQYIQRKGEEEAYEEPLITPSDARRHKRTVMIELIHAAVAHPTMLGSEGAVDMTRRAILPSRLGPCMLVAWQWSDLTVGGLAGNDTGVYQCRRDQIDVAKYN
jgi:hypothetical protein